MTWIKVFEAPICVIMEKPTGMRKAHAIQNDRENANRISAAPKAAVDNMIQRPKPVTPCLTASISAPASAPAPEKPMSSPRPRAPEWKI